MGLMHSMRRHAGRPAPVNAALLGLIWLSIVVSPCAMAMEPEPEQVAAQQVRPHCLLPPSHDVQPDDCDELYSLALRPREQVKTFSLALLAAASGVRVAERAAHPTHVAEPPPARAGPRAHLLNQQFNE